MSATTETQIEEPPAPENRGRLGNRETPVVVSILVEIDEHWSTATKAYLKWENQIEHGNQKSIHQVA